MMRLGSSAVLGVLTCTLLTCGPSAGDKAPPPSERVPGALVVQYSDTRADTFAAPNVDSILAFDWLQIYSNSTGNLLSIRHLSFGDLIIGIGDTFAGDEGDWLYQINGEMATQAVNKQRVATSDTVLFFFQ
jgi:hypothetical protein